MNSGEFLRCDVLVVGGGPAGLAAAATAAGNGCQVLLVDDNPSLGGQIWRGGTANAAAEAKEWLEQLRRSNVRVLAGTRVVHQPEPDILLAERVEGPLQLQYGRLILATGARERFLPFPGWTLPNVMGAGGLQALVKSGLPIAGKRVVVAGTGPLLVAVAAYLRGHGAEIPMICEQAGWSALARFGVSLLGERRKFAQALAFRSELKGVRFAASCWPLEAHGVDKLEAVTVARAGTMQRIACDYLACGFHLVPNTELAVLLGCRVRQGFVEVNEFQQTSIPNLYCAGEPTGIGGVEVSVLEGQVAGFAASRRPEGAQKLFGARRRARRFAQTMDHTFQLRPALRELSRPETIVCRCEDVPLGRLRRYGSWREAKLQSRCGMGACQGRVCGPATEFLFHWRPDSVRPPIFPTTFSSLAGLAGDSVGDPLAVTGEHS
jgi:NADPH-dependent 2,4-dienoyl-CoA reductase/sulfur reductase-like enzyme